MSDLDVEGAVPDRKEKFLSLVANAQERLAWAGGRIISTSGLVLGLLFLPCLCYGTSRSLNNLARRVEQAAESFGSAILRSSLILKRLNKENNQTAEYCSNLFDNAAPVFLVSSSIDWMASTSSRRPRSDSSERVTVPITQQANGLWTPQFNANTLSTSHWAIVTRDIMYDLVRTKGSRSIELRTSRQGEALATDAMGIPLAAEFVYELGVTFLTDTDVRYLVAIERE